MCSEYPYELLSISFMKILTPAKFCKEQPLVEHNKRDLRPWNAHLNPGTGRDDVFASGLSDII